MQHNSAAGESENSVASEQILFLHLPKTAGTALRNLFARHLGEDQVSKNLNMRLEEALGRYSDFRAICGHLHAEQGQTLPRERVSITVLRDPIDRFLSYFYFRKFDAQNHAVDRRVLSLDIDQYIDELADGDLVDLNLQTALLYPLGTQSLTILSWPERVAAAQVALDDIDFVGIHSEIDDFVSMIAARMGWAGDKALDRVNVTSRRVAPDQLAPASRRKLDELLQYDRLVYEHAVERFRRLRRASILASGVRRNVRPAMGTQNGADRQQSSRGVSAPREFGDRRLEIASVRVSGEMSGASLAMIGEQIMIYIEFVAHEAADKVTAGFLIRDERGLPVFGTTTHLLGDTHHVAPGRYCFCFAFVNRMEGGAYTVDAMLIRNNSYLEGCHHWKDNAASFDVHGWATVSFNGRVMMDARATFAQLSAQGSIEARRVSIDPSTPALSSGRLNSPLRDFSARITPLSSLPAVSMGAELLVNIDIENTGVETWRAYGKHLVSLSYHWLDADNNVITFDGLRTCLPRDLEPGERILLHGLLRAPHRTGELRLIWTMVQEGVSWFDSKDAQSKCCVDVTVC
ncbi:MAG: Wzt carbohydrate-binding domain-containing protein [Dokdonella sp.]